MTLPCLASPYFASRSVQDPLVHHGRHFGRTVHSFCSVQTLLTNGIVSLAEESEAESLSAVYVNNSLVLIAFLTITLQRETGTWSVSWTFEDGAWFWSPTCGIFRGRSDWHCIPCASHHWCILGSCTHWLFPSFRKGWMGLVPMTQKGWKAPSSIGLHRRGKRWIPTSHGMPSRGEVSTTNALERFSALPG